MRSKAKIVLVSYYPLSHQGGLTRYARDMQRALQSLGNVTTVLEGRTSRDGESPSIIKDLFWGLRCFLSLTTYGPDVVHSHSHWSTAIPGFLLKTIGSAHMNVFTFHTPPPKVLRPLRRRLFSLVLSKCNYVSFVSESLAETYSKVLKLPSNRLVIHPSYRQYEVAQREIDDFTGRFNLAGNHTLICFMGPLVWEGKVKGVELLIRSFASVLDRNRKILLLVVGDGPLRSNLEKLARRLGCSNSVIFTGTVDNPGVPLIMSQIYAHISFQEGLPHSLLDAMAASKAIIASNIGGIPEAVTDGTEGLLVSNKQEEIGECLERLISSPGLRKELGKNARARALAHFGIKRMAQELTGMYGDGQ